MMVADARPELERLLADALRPIEPPEDLAGRMEQTLSAVTEAAASELSEWADELSDAELAALRDPQCSVASSASACAARQSRARHRHPFDRGRRRLGSRASLTGVFCRFASELRPARG